MSIECKFGAISRCGSAQVSTSRTGKLQKKKLYPATLFALFDSKPNQKILFVVKLYSKWGKINEEAQIFFCGNISFLRNVVSQKHGKVGYFGRPVCSFLRGFEPLWGRFGCGAAHQASGTIAPPPILKFSGPPPAGAPGRRVELWNFEDILG